MIHSMDYVNYSRFVLFDVDCDWWFLSIGGFYHIRD